MSVTIPLGSNAAAIGKRLAAAGVVRSALAFTIAARLMGDSNGMKAGEYLIPANKGVFEIIDQLESGNAVARWVSIPEGMSLADVAKVLEDRHMANAREFMRAAHRRPASYGLNVPVTRRSVEGYLMPDTYKLPSKSSERTIIKEMLKNWNTKIWKPNQTRFGGSDLPLDKVVIVASMIEREARVDRDRPLISSVIRNRLLHKMPLQIDATIIYALGRHKNELSFKDLKIPSRYNTYRNKGLPPGPICSPGAKSILAALQPATTPYLYYVAQPDGSHIFTETMEQHKAAILKVKAMRAGTVVGASR